jgi:methanogenic corrinoid protein MtbC1
MNGKDRILKTLKHEKVDRVAWVPFAGVHAGSLIGKNASEMLSNGQNLFDGLMQVHKLYQPDGMPVIFDLQVEAEILGCELHWAEFGPPSVKTHPLAETNEMLCDCLQPAANKGRLPMILDVMRKIKAEVGADTALYGLICGPFTLASHLRGNELFMDLILEEEYVQNLMAYTTTTALKMIDLYAEAGMDIIGVNFKAKEIYVPDVLIAARAMKAGTDILKPLLVRDGVKAIGTVIMGTVKGDLHDIGKNLVVMMMEGKGLQVIDLGTDVPAEKFVEAAIEHKAHIIACSALLTTTLGEMQSVVEVFKAANLRDTVKIMVGGAPIAEAFCQSIGADIYQPDVASAAEAAAAAVLGLSA